VCQQLDRCALAHGLREVRRLLIAHIAQVTLPLCCSHIVRLLDLHISHCDHVDELHIGDLSNGYRKIRFDDHRAERIGICCGHVDGLATPLQAVEAFYEPLVSQDLSSIVAWMQRKDSAGWIAFILHFCR
jgi:hypothetical protein